MWQKINSFLERHEEDAYLVAVIAVVAILSFGLGRLSVHYGTEGEFKIIYPEGEAEITPGTISEP